MNVEPLPYELRIGVTGHRNLPDANGVARAVHDLLDRLQTIFDSASEYPYGPAGTPRPLVRRIDDLMQGVLRIVWPSLAPPQFHVPIERRTPLHWVVSSPLAKGADQIVADAVLKRPHARLKVSTPFPIEDYRKDFDTVHDSVEFERLLSQDASPVELPNAYGREEPADSDAIKQSKLETRRDGYEQIGRHIVNFSEIVIAIWNGGEAKGRGGTGDIVRYAVENQRTVIWIDSENPSREPQVLVPAKQADPHGGDENAAWFEARPLPKRAREISAGFHQLAAYNRDLLRDVDAAEEKLARRRAHLLDEAEKAGLAAETVRPAIDALAPQYIRADQLASRYQSIFVTLALWIHSLAAIAVTIAVCQFVLAHDRVWLVWFEVAAMFAALFLQRVNGSQRWRDRWLNDRHLAEQVRMAMFTIYFGRIGDDARGHAQVLPFYPGPWPWISAAVNSLVQPIRESLHERPPAPALAKWLEQVWLREQAAWHHANARRKEHNARHLHRVGFAAFAATLVLSLLHASGVGHSRHSGYRNAAGVEVPLVAAAGHDRPLDAAVAIPEVSRIKTGEELEPDPRNAVGRWFVGVIPPQHWELAGRLLVVLAIALPAWGAAAHSFNTLRDYERIATRSTLMHQILAGIAGRVERVSTYDALGTEVQQALDLMRAENEEWMASFRIGSDPRPV